MAAWSAVVWYVIEESGFRFGGGIDGTTLPDGVLLPLKLPAPTINVAL